MEQIPLYTLLNFQKYYHYLKGSHSLSSKTWLTKTPELTGEKKADLFSSPTVCPKNTP